MLYNHEKNLKATEERIKRSNICEANKQYIFEFENYCFAEGLKIARVLKHLVYRIAAPLIKSIYYYIQ